MTQDKGPGFPAGVPTGDPRNGTVRAVITAQDGLREDLNARLAQTGTPSAHPDNSPAVTASAQTAAELEYVDGVGFVTKAALQAHGKQWDTPDPRMDGRADLAALKAEQNKPNDLLALWSLGEWRDRPTQEVTSASRPAPILTDEQRAANTAAARRDIRDIGSGASWHARGGKSPSSADRQATPPQPYGKF